MFDLSILIPARNEMFLAKTVENLLENIEGNTEIIVVLDGQWADPAINDDPRVTIVYLPEPIGQRAATNLAARLSKSKYVMKLDAHCAVSKGFDRILMEDMQDDWTVVPKMYNLYAFDWVCPEGHRRYQSPSGDCKTCGKPTVRDIVWKPKPSPETTSMSFDRNLRFQYFSGYKAHQEGDLVETMSLLGACWMLTRKKYWELNISDEEHGSWGQQGTEVACKTWLSGGKLICNKRAWFAHMFRTQGGDFGFPYPNGGVNKAREFSHQQWINAGWKGAIRPIWWLIKKFKPTQWEVKSKGIIYYTDNQLQVKIAKKVQNNLLSIGLPIVSASLKPMPHFGKNIHVPLKRGHLTMFKQILAALEASDAEIIYFCEHDVIYHPSHFDIIPPREDTFYYNTNVWKIRQEDGHALWVDDCRQVSGIVVYRETAIKHYRERIAKIEALGRFERNMGFEPGTHNRVEWENKFHSESVLSEFPNIDMRHSHNLTANRWSKDLFRNQKYTNGWKESKVWELPGWDPNEFRSILGG